MRIPVLGKLFGRKKEGYAYRVYRSIHSQRRRAGIFYFPFRWLFRTAARIQHSEISVIGLENVPPDGSVLLVGNHPNSFLDYFNLLTVVRHPIATAAKDTLTNVPVVGPQTVFDQVFDVEAGVDYECGGILNVETYADEDGNPRVEVSSS